MCGSQPNGNGDYYNALTASKYRWRAAVSCANLSYKSRNGTIYTNSSYRRSSNNRRGYRTFSGHFTSNYRR